jgi:predicted O-methyltransferase YrrM
MRRGTHIGYPEEMRAGVLRMRARRLRRAPHDAAQALAITVASHPPEPREGWWLERIEELRADHGRNEREAGSGPIALRLLRELRPERCIALGAAVPVAHLALALELNRHGQLVAVEQSQLAAAQTRAYVSRLGLAARVDIRSPTVLEPLGRFDCAYLGGEWATRTELERTIPLLAGAAVVVLDGVTTGSREWRRLRDLPRVALTATVGSLTLVALD